MQKNNLLQNKSLITNLFTVLIIITGHITNNHIIISIGYFAFSGSITNWIAIHMLFEKVPFLYGSGVIPNRFNDFKNAIKKIIINEFFNKEHIEKFINNDSVTNDDLTKKIDFEKIYQDLVQAIIASPLGGMLQMVGGAGALEPMKESMIGKLKEIATETAATLTDDQNISDGIIEKVENIIDKRLEELTPSMVKQIVQDIIKQHLGWLVVWGGVFGGLIGLIMSIITK